MATTLDSPPSSLPCRRCGNTLRPLYPILDPTSGKQYRTFKCAGCGRLYLHDIDRAMVE